MKSTELKVSRIGNSRGVRLPAASLKRYRIGSAVIIKETSEGIFLQPVGPSVQKLSWENTASEMAGAHEDWGEWEKADADGLEGVPWESEDARKIAEKKAIYGSARRNKQANFLRYEIRWVSLDSTGGAPFGGSSRRCTESNLKSCG